MQKTTPEQRKAEAVQRLLAPGRRRLDLLAQLNDLDEEIRPLVLEAIEAAIPYRRITELTGVSPVTISKWKRALAAS